MKFFWFLPLIRCYRYQLLDSTVPAIKCGLSSKDTDAQGSTGVRRALDDGGGSTRKRAKTDSIFSEGDVNVLKQVFNPIHESTSAS